MGRLKDLFKYVFVTSAAALVFTSAAISSSAYRIPSSDIYPDRVIDGKTFSPIILEANDFYEMFLAGDFKIDCIVTSNLSSTIYDYQNGQSSTFYPTVNIPADLNNVRLISAVTRATEEFIVEYPVMISSTGNVSVSYNVQLPFSYMFLGGELNYKEFTSINNTSGASLSFILNTPYDTSYQSIFEPISYASLNWSESNIYLENLVVAFNLNFSKPATLVSYEMLPNLLHEVNSLTLSSSYTGNSTGSISPFGIVFGEWVVYINNDNWEDPDKPTYSEVVQDYLDQIVNLSPENQSQIDELRSQLNEVDSVFNDISDGLKVDIPDVDNLGNDIDDDLIYGSTQFSEQILSPILNSHILIMLFGGLFAVVTMKLVLFGSGKS